MYAITAQLVIRQYDDNGSHADTMKQLPAFTIQEGDDKIMQEDEAILAALKILDETDSEFSLIEQGFDKGAFEKLPKGKRHMLFHICAVQI